VKVLTSVTNQEPESYTIGGRWYRILININVVPASGVEPERLAAGDFKSPTYPVQINDLGYFRKHEMTLNVSET
jgi:hypothetical protein